MGPAVVRTCIYLPDDLAREVKRYPLMNVSAVCQSALRAEVAMLDALVPRIDRDLEWFMSTGPRSTYRSTHEAAQS